MGLALGFLMLFALVLIGVPIGLSATPHPIGALASSIMISSGVALAIICSTLLTITKLYVKTRASEAFVRTGMGGLKVIRDGGAIVIPVVHQVVRVSLETIRLEVLRAGAEAMITSDKLRADIKAEFFVRVQPNDEAIQNASRSLGDKMNEDAGQRDRNSGQRAQSSVAALIEDKLVSALRTSAARKTLEQLNSERDEFLKEVTQLVTADLNHNGFTLETVTISKLDQTDEQHLKANNIFDAQGMRTIAEITQKNLTEKNQIVRDGEQARTGQDVETRKKVLTMEREKAEAEAGQATQIAVIQAEQERLSKEKTIQADQSVALAGVQQQQAIEVAKRLQSQAIEVAERDKVKAITEADQGVEVARRGAQKAVAEAEAQKAGAEAKLYDAEATRQKAKQNIITVEQVAEAEREKQKGIIAAQATAEKLYVTTQKAADGEAYKTKTDADARKASADADAEATRKKASADADAQTAKAAGSQAATVAEAEGNKAKLLAEAEGSRAKLLAEAEGTRSKLLAEAEGQKALAMVPVEVAAKHVDNEKRRVEEVLVPELAARAENGKAAQDFELEKFRIEMEAQVRIANGKATVELYNKITANVYGTPEDVAKMGQAFSNGMGISQMAGGFLAGANPQTIEVAKRAGEAIEGAITTVTDRLKAPKSGEPVNGAPG